MVVQEPTRKTKIEFGAQKILANDVLFKDLRKAHSSLQTLVLHSKAYPDVTARCDVRLPEVMLQTSEQPPPPAEKSLNSKIYRVAGTLVALSCRAQDYGFNTTLMQPSSLSRKVR